MILELLRDTIIHGIIEKKFSDIIVNYSYEHLGLSENSWPLYEVNTDILHEKNFMNKTSSSDQELFMKYS